MEVGSSIVEPSIFLARQQVRFFEVIRDSKVPAVDKFSERATDNLDDIRKLFSDPRRCNSGIATGKIGNGLFLWAVDVDFKDNRNGFQTLKELQNQKLILPETWSQSSPSGGCHFLYWTPEELLQGTNVLGLGIDTRSSGGYILGPGSSIGGKFYTPINQKNIVMAPQWCLEKYRKSERVISIAKEAIKPVEDQVLALKSSVEYLQMLPPVSQGARNDELYKAISRIKDFGLSADQIPEIIVTYWKADPMLELSEIRHVVNSAFQYGKNPPGNMAPETLLTKIEMPASKEAGPPELEFNKDHFYVAEGRMSWVYREGKFKGRFHLYRWSVQVFHEKYLAKVKFGDGGKKYYLTEQWLSDPRRRKFEGVRFDPSDKADPDFYNLWRGFDVAPLGDSEEVSIDAKKSVDMFFDHCLRNVCGGDKNLNHWLISFFAHLCQKPGEKPQCSLVFKGLKGTGKTIISEIIGHLIGEYAVILSDKHSLATNFNSILEDKLLVTLDEAFWSGDKTIDSKLKGIITGKKRRIEHKGIEAYPTDVFDRIIIIGNDDHLVLASGDERRYAVFNVGDDNIRDQTFFKTMRHGIERLGGDRLLMKKLMEYDCSGADIDIAPNTSGLAEQKEHSLDVFQSWWKECLHEERILGSGIEGWPEEIAFSVLYEAFINQLGKDKSRAYTPTKIRVAKSLKHMSPLCSRQIRTASAKKYSLAPVDVARGEFNNFIGHKVKW